MSFEREHRDSDRDAKAAHLSLVRSAISSAPLATLQECQDFLAWCIGRIEQFDREQPSLDLCAVIDDLSDAEHELSKVVPSDPAESARERAEQWAFETRREHALGEVL